MDNDYYLAWSADIVDELAGRDAATAGRFHLVEPADLSAFLSGQTQYQIVTGSRGMGKSATLFFKASNLSKNPGFRLVRDTYPYVYRLASLSVLIPAERISMYSTHRAWTPVWTLVLGTLFSIKIAQDTLNTWTREPSSILDQFEIPKGTDESAYFETAVRLLKNPHREPLSTLLSWLIERGIKPEIQQSWFKLYIDPHLIIPSSDTRYAIFVDAIDEAFGVTTFAKDSIDLSPGSRSNVTVENAKLTHDQLWMSAQTAFAEAAFFFRTSYTHRILVFGSMRPEAVEVFPTRSNLTKSKVAQTILPLKYSAEEMKSIFERNVDLTAKSGLANPNSKDPTERFLGSTTVPSRVVWGVQEHLTDSLIRHSFGSPRDIVVLGGAIRSNVPPALRVSDPSSVVTEINRAAIDVVKEHLNNVYPPWDPSYNDAIKLITANILRRDEIERIENNFAAARRAIVRNAPAPGQEAETESLFEYLYLRQLVGIPHAENKSTLKIRFHDASGPKIPFPSIPEYCVLHPAFAAFVRLQLTDLKTQMNFYQGHFLVGEGLQAPSKFRYPIFKIAQNSEKDRWFVFARSMQLEGYDERKPTEKILVLKGLLCAIKRSESSVVGFDQIAKEIEWLTHRRYIRAGASGEHASYIHKETGDHFREVLNYDDERVQPHCVRSLKELLSEHKIGLDHTSDGLFSLKDRLGSGAMGREIEPYEIIIDLPNHA